MHLPKLSSYAQNSTFNQPFEGFLKKVIAWFPTEARLMLGEAEVSPESAFMLPHPEAWTFKFFPAADITDHREFERGDLALRHLYDVITDNRANMPTLDDDCYNRLRLWLNKALTVIGDERAIIWSTLFNDLGKLDVCRQWYHNLTGSKNTDHDAVFSYLIRHAPEHFPGLAILREESVLNLIKGLETGFNLGQALQLECPAASWAALEGLEERSRTLFLVHSIFDILGVKGAENPQRAPAGILNNNIVDALLDIAEAPNYTNYLEKRAQNLNFRMNSDEDHTLARLAGMSRSYSLSDARQLRLTWQALPPAVQAILKRELVNTGAHKRQAILPYYGPGLIAATRKKNPENGLAIAFTLMARVLFEVRNKLGPAPGPGIVIANMHELATRIGKEDIDNQRIKVREADGGYTIHTEPFPILRPGMFVAQHLEKLPYKPRTAFIGMGGGSDGNQGAALAFAAGIDDACVISVHGAFIGSQGGKAELGKARVINNAKEIIEGVYLINPQSTSNGRFTANKVAQYMETYVVLDPEDGTLAERLSAALAFAGHIETVYGVDTGGDALHHATANGFELTQTSPDQDLRTLQALAKLKGMQVYTAILATGVDSPDDVEDVLRKANAIRYTLNAKQTDKVMQAYREWGMDASASSLIGKTPLVLQAALSTKALGTVHTLPIPLRYVLEETNPWNPFVLVTEAMRDIFVMTLKNHLKAIGA